MSKSVMIEPVTRLEGHGKIAIFLNDAGNVEDAFFQVTELRGFERFCIGRPVEEMPRIVSNICGVCPSAHNMAGTKAVDGVFGVEPTPTARLIRELHFNAFMVEDHFIHFFFLAAPDFIVGPKADPASRNVLGLIGAVGEEAGRAVIEVRKRNREIIRRIASKPCHPESGVPGGHTKRLTEEDREYVKETAKMSIDFIKVALRLFKDKVLANKDLLGEITADYYNLKTHYMALVDPNGKMNFYDGQLKVIDWNGKEVLRFDPNDYEKYIGEWVEPWTYIRLTYLRQMGWKGLVEGPGTSLYRVGPLARMNVVDGMATPLAQEEYMDFVNTLGKPAHQTLAYSWARLIECLQAAEDMLRIASDPALTGSNVRNMDYHIKKRGVGCVDAPRGVLIHHYETDEKAILNKANLIVATQHNAAPICLSVKKAAQGLIKDGNVNEGLLNMVEMAFRAYDPCLSCATHTLPGEMPMEANIYGPDKTLLRTIRQNM